MFWMAACEMSFHADSTRTHSSSVVTVGDDIWANVRAIISHTCSMGENRATEGYVEEVVPVGHRENYEQYG